MNQDPPTGELADLRAIAGAVGIEWTYFDIAGTSHDANPESVLAVVRALGHNLDGLGGAGELARALTDAAAQRPPIAVVWDDQPDPQFEYGIERDETGWTIAAPSRGASSRESHAAREVGVFAPLHSLHRSPGRGIGDLPDLATFADIARRWGASGVATLPLLSRVAGERSPYLPSSRQFFDELWLADRVTRDAAPAVRLVDPEPIRARRLERLQQLAVEAAAASDRELDRFAADHPASMDYARFRALADTHGQNWRGWPRTVRADPGAVRAHLYTQFRVTTELDQVREHFDANGQFLALDLPLGCHPDGFDVWQHPEMFALGLSVGAPPDGFSPAGQSWGFPPPNPHMIAASGFALFRAALRAHLRFASVLRVDHVMGLQRLFCIPDGGDPSDGVYIRMPLDPLVAVICIEAHRARADVYGEDLGTVTPELRAAMTDHGLRRSYVGQFAIDVGRHDGAPPLAPPPANSVASFGTHDLPPFAAWRDGADIEERRALGLIDSAEADRQQQARSAATARLSDLSDPADDPSPASMLNAIHRELANSEAGIVMISLDDLLGDHESINVPGTSIERPNWQLRTAPPLDEIATLQVALPRRAPRARASNVQLSADDLHLFNEGRHFQIADKLGAHVVANPRGNATTATTFAVWAPNARGVSVIGDFNGWDDRTHPMQPHGVSGIWERTIDSVGRGARYKYRITPAVGAPFDKADPYAAAAEPPPNTASVVWESTHVWNDAEWLRARPDRQRPDRPMSIYEVHLGSWMRTANGQSLSYRDIAPRLADHVAGLGFTHVELLPVMEHPFFGSWGYQVSGYFAPSARFGTPDDFRCLVDYLHGREIGVILDWVPSHFPDDSFSLATFDGTHLYEHADERQRVHPDWQSWIFNYGRSEVRSFLVGNACYWIDEFHADGIRVDAVASMLYLDYSRADGEWIPNRFGGRENLEAISLLHDFNDAISLRAPGVVTIAEESTAWPGVTRTAQEGGLGFAFKWDMGWMHDTLDYIRHVPVHRVHHHDEITFRAMYGTSERFVLALSHDEVVHGKGTFLSRMPGDDWQQFANLRLLYGYQWFLNGKKLLFMGGELATRTEWNHDGALDWSLLDHAAHRGVADWIAALNRIYRERPELHEGDCTPDGFDWIDCSDREQSVLSFERRAEDGRTAIVVANFTPVPRTTYAIGAPHAGPWQVAADSDAVEFGGSGFSSQTEVVGMPIAWHGRTHRIELDLPPLGILLLLPVDAAKTSAA